MPESDQTREDRAIQLAERRAGEMARVEARLEDHDKHLQRINGSVRQTALELHGVRDEVGNLRAEFRQSVAVATARASDAEKAASRQVTSRELYFTAAGLLIALAGLLSATGHL